MGILVIVDESRIPQELVIMGNLSVKKERMEVTKLAKVFLLLLALAFALEVIQVNKTEAWVSESSQPQRDQSLKGCNEAWTMRKSWKPMIGSTAPTCTYNECRGCKYKCRAEQVPVEGNDPINSPYHYRCKIIDKCNLIDDIIY
ncbi:EPIDERMAL PATTERNING FACTOR-like protein 9, partial [Mucuna pruriens]